MSVRPVATPARLPDADYEAFGKAVFALRAEVMADLNDADRTHFYKMILANRLFTIVGYALAWIVPNPISWYCISQGIHGRWMEMHHIGHGGYDQVPGMPKYMHSSRFAMGWRRFIDWFDWIYPPAWNHEHNVLHHHYTSERIDPDRVQDHADVLRDLDWPRWLRYALVSFMSVTWKFSYYAPNTMRTLDLKPNESTVPQKNIFVRIWHHGLDVRRTPVRRLWLYCYLPYSLTAFVVIPLLFLPLGWWAVGCVLINRIMAEALANFHSFLVVGPNHTGDDLYSFDGHFSDRADFCVRQVISACNYPTGTITGDYLHGWLNYQIEHHLYPRIPIRRYAMIQPRIKALCEQYRIPYVQESVFKRFRMMVRVMIGDGSLRRLPGGPHGPSSPVPPAVRAPATAPSSTAVMAEPA